MEDSSGIKHRTLHVNGIYMHIAEKGQGPLILFLHGFPELWYSWRHQIHSLASRGYHVVAPDLRGYGDTEAPKEISSYSCLHLVGDIVGLINALGHEEEQVFLVAHDMGALMGWYMCMFRPDLVRAFVSLSVPFRPRNPKFKPVDTLRAYFGDHYYICRFQEPGEIEAEIAQFSTKDIIKKIISDRHPGPPCLPRENPFGISADAPVNLPSWFSEDDLQYYADKYAKKGFTGPLNHYRNLNLNWELTAPWTGVQLKVPVKLLVGDMDMVYNMPGVQEYIHQGGFKKDVPLLEEVVVMKGVAHFINQEIPAEINDHIYDFISKF